MITSQLGLEETHVWLHKQNLYWIGVWREHKPVATMTLCHTDCRATQTVCACPQQQKSAMCKSKIAKVCLKLMVNVFHINTKYVLSGQ